MFSRRYHIISEVIRGRAHHSTYSGKSPLEDYTSSGHVALEGQYACTCASEKGEKSVCDLT
jgi:hypothetical protein